MGFFSEDSETIILGQGEYKIVSSKSLECGLAICNVCFAVKILRIFHPFALVSTWNPWSARHAQGLGKAVTAGWQPLSSNRIYVLYNHRAALGLLKVLWWHGNKVSNSRAWRICWCGSCSVGVVFMAVGPDASVWSASRWAPRDSSCPAGRRKVRPGVFVIC